MGRELTKRHSSVFQKKVSNPLLFAQDIYRYGKFSELISFVVWELLHRLRLFPEEQYLKFTGSGALALDGQELTGVGFDQQLDSFFAGQGLDVTRVAHNWKLMFLLNEEIVGAQYPDDTVLYRSTDGGKSRISLKQFPERIKSVFISSRNTIFVCVKGALYRSSDGGDSFKKTLELGSPKSYFRHNNGMTETPDGTLVIGEYGNHWEGNGWRKLAYLYVSSDDGETWKRSDFLIGQGVNKHVHLVKYSSTFDKLFMADGDNYKKLWVSELSDSDSLVNGEAPWEPVNRFHIQMGGYTSVVESDGKVLFGTDYQGGTNFVVETTDGENFTGRVVPDPYRRSPLDNMVVRKSRQREEIWANLPYSTAKSKCLLMYSNDGGESWNKVFDYRRDTHKVWLISSSKEAVDELYLSIENSSADERVVYKIADRSSG